jgi:predicted metalloprotease
MRLDDAPESDNVEDQRGMGSKLAIGGAGGVVLLILGLIFGVDFGGGQPRPAVNNAPPDEKTKVFAEKVLGTLEKVWQAPVREAPPGVQGGVVTTKIAVVHRRSPDRMCGTAPSAVGPFYCPADRHVYLDPTFFDELEQRLGGSKAAFSQAYVIAHEVGHHVQNLLGYSSLVDEHRGTRDEKQYSVRLELMADYLAGVWAHDAEEKFHVIEPGDVKAAITSANAIGDDKLQKRSGAFVHPEKFTHGTSRQRIHFFEQGLKTGDASKATLDKFFEAKMKPNGEIEDF